METDLTKELRRSAGINGDTNIAWKGADEIVRLRVFLFKIQCEQLRIASATDMTRPAMREAAMETRNEIIQVLAISGEKRDV